MIYSQSCQYCRIGLISSDQIRAWAQRRLSDGEVVGCVSQPSTLDYQTHKPERDGLFCERIFGPVKSHVCACGKYQDTADKADRPSCCEDCGVELTESRVRRHRMAYIDLECRITHAWYFKQRPNHIARLLNQSSNSISSLVYYHAWLARPAVHRPTLLLFCIQRPISDAPLDLFDFDYGWIRVLERFLSSKAFKVLQEREIITGADAIHKLLSKLRLEAAMNDCRTQWQALTKARAHKQIEALPADLDLETIQQTKFNALLRRLILLRAVFQAQVKPEWTVLSCLPVLPPALRPVLELRQGQLVTSDLNSLYQVVISRNNRLLFLKHVRSPAAILNNQRKLIQQGADALLANGMGAAPLTDRDRRAYKSFSDILKGKRGRFRENLLGKRVDYSGRSVIVVGPSLAFNQCGLPREMAIELLQPFVIRELIASGLVRNLRAAKSELISKAPIVWKVLFAVLQQHVVILNRAPTLHRLGMQAFQPVLVRERAIHLHPLVCTGFNADFDGDQMAVHVPLSLEAQAEARIVMLPSVNLLSPGTGEAITVPSQDMLLGLYVLTLPSHSRTDQNHRYLSHQSLVDSSHLSVPTFSNCHDVLIAHHQGQVHYHSRVWLRWIPTVCLINVISREVPIEFQQQPLSEGGSLSIYEHLQIRSNETQDLIGMYVRTTVGRVLFNQQIEQASASNNWLASSSSTRSIT